MERLQKVVPHRCLGAPSSSASDSERSETSSSRTPLPKTYSAERDDLRALFNLAVSDCGGAEPDAFLGWGDFQAAFGVECNAPLIKRIFDLLDPDGDGSISFDCFADGLYPLYSQHATQYDRLMFLFRCFDLDGSDTISKSELLTALERTLSQHGIPSELHEQVVSDTFLLFGAEGDEEISWELFEAYYSSRPEEAKSLARRVELDVNRLLVDVWMSVPDRWMERGCGEHGNPTLVLERGALPGLG